MRLEFALPLLLGIIAFSPGLSRAAGQADGELCVLRSVQDGDTLTLDCPRKRGVKVRLHCIDAPELDQTPWGVRSRGRLAELIGGKFSERNGRLEPQGKTKLRLVRREVDSYGRIVGEVYPVGGDGRPLNLRMVVDGWAAVYPQYCDDAEYADAERIAKAARLGIWKRSGTQQRPWEWRHRGG